MNQTDQPQPSCRDYCFEIRVSVKYHFGSTSPDEHSHIQTEFRQALKSIFESLSINTFFLTMTKVTKVELQGFLCNTTGLHHDPQNMDTQYLIGLFKHNL